MFSAKISVLLLLGWVQFLFPKEYNDRHLLAHVRHSLYTCNEAIVDYILVAQIVKFRLNSYQIIFKSCFQTGIGCREFGCIVGVTSELSWILMHLDFWSHDLSEFCNEEAT